MNCSSDGYGQLAGGVDDGQRAGIIISREYAAYAPGKCNHEQALADSRQKTCSDRNFQIGSEKQTEPSCGSDGGKQRDCELRSDTVQRRTYGKFADAGSDHAGRDHPSGLCKRESDGNPVRGNMLIDAGYDLQQNHGG